MLTLIITGCVNMADPNLGLQQQVNSLKELVETKKLEEEKREGLPTNHLYFRGKVRDGLIIIKEKP
jgi:hypothetical protein